MKIVPQQVTYRYHYGSDLEVVNAARVSFDKESTEFGDGDARLIAYLAKHNHWTPFGHAGATFRIKAPIFVARQLVKHQVGLVWNEVSRRYVDHEPEFYFPASWRARPEGNIKQGSTGVVDLNVLAYDDLTMEENVEDAVEYCLTTYKRLLEYGVAPEQARMVLPLNTMTEWIWTGSLAAWSRVCKLRLDPHAQEETQEIAQMISKQMSDLFPVSWKALME